jgi:hypothetical protein
MRFHGKNRENWFKRIKPGNGLLGGDKGAFVNAIALASDALDYLSQITRELDVWVFTSEE